MKRGGTGATVAIVAIFLVFVLLTALLSDKSEGPSYRSDDAEPGGAKALYLLFEEVGFRVSGKTRGADAVRSDGAILLLGAEEKDYSSRDLSDVLAFVEAGGILAITGEWKDFFSRCEREDLLPSGFAEDADYLVPGYYAKSYGEGQFRLIPMNSADFANASLAGNPTEAKRLIDILWDLRERPLYFEDYRGFSLPAADLAVEGDPAYLLMPQPVRLALVACALLLFAGLLFYRKRLGPPDVYRKDGHRAQNEDVRAFSNLMERGGLAADALLLLYRDLFRAACGRAPSLKREEFPDEAGRLSHAFMSRGYGTTEVEEVNRAVEHALFTGEADEKTAVNTARLMDDLKRALSGDAGFRNREENGDNVVSNL
ncbi:DUF4350 domain-containing protein [Oscillospiraceae bacterium OttesenSCG-928-G22]|nr:DUF4350 domain-containing protein [Oscillospiraceae bacterium OttesenSCG-928-G22]